MSRHSIKTPDSEWEALYRIGGIAALTVLVLMIFQVFVYLAWPPPDTVEGWFALFQGNKIAGLLAMDFLLMVDYVLLIPVYLALFIILRPAGRSLMAIATVLAVVSVVIYFASNTCFDMLSLSNHYATATTDAEKSIVLAAGQAMLATYQGTAFNTSYVISAVALLLISVVMIRSTAFSKQTAVMGILMGGCMIVPPTAGEVGMFLSFLSLVPTAIWLMLVARGLFQLRMKPDYRVRGKLQEIR